MIGLLKCFNLYHKYIYFRMLWIKTEINTLAYIASENDLKYQKSAWQQ